jgi:hypothetical protein
VGSSLFCSIPLGLGGDTLEPGFLGGLLGDGGDMGAVGSGVVFGRLGGAGRPWSGSGGAGFRIDIGGGADLLSLHLVLNLIEDLWPDYDVGKGAELGDPATAHEPGQHEEVGGPVGLAGGELFIRTRGLGELSEEIGEGRSKRECSLPLEGVEREAGEITIWGEDVLVLGV